MIPGDSGFIGNIELVSPDFSVSQHVGAEVNERWNLVAFYDVAALGIPSPLIGETSPSLQGLGLGVKCRINKNINGRLEYGWNAGDQGFIGTAPGSGRFHFGLTVKY